MMEHEEHLKANPLDAHSETIDFDGPLAPATTFAGGRYVPVRVLGVGGQKVVYLAHDPQLDRRVALKLLHVDARPRPGKPSNGHAKVLREAKALAKLSHPNVVTIHDV